MSRSRNRLPEECRCHSLDSHLLGGEQFGIKNEMEKWRAEDSGGLERLPAQGQGWEPYATGPEKCSEGLGVEG